MFTGIIESMGIVKNLVKEGDNIHISVESNLTPELRIDQSMAHNGICLTIVNIDGNTGNTYTVTAIKETLEKTNLGNLEIGSKINLERAMILGDRLDGHIVQGHVDQIATCSHILEEDGSWVFTFQYNSVHQDNITIEKGSITVNGVSLTVINSKENEFGVAIIPYTFDNTNFHQIKVGTAVNLEFDVIGKYVARLLKK
ncbi:MAG: riboflavin synthase [Flavobacteriaceae bacterium]|nr:riboflavin synthase [Flavobacteriaceae bacterium]